MTRVLPRHGRLTAAILAASVVLFLVPAVARDGARSHARESRVTAAIVPRPGFPRQAAGRSFKQLPKSSWRLSLSGIGLESPPISLAAAGRYLLLVTPDRTVLAIETGSGKVAWRRNRGDLGVTPRLVLSREPETALILGDPGEPPVSVRISTGAVHFSWPGAARVLQQSGCALKSVSVVSVVDTGPSLAIHDTTGQLVRRARIPWPEYHASHPLQRQILLARDASGARCVGALVLGPGLAAFDDASVLWTAPYREDIRPPEVRVRTIRGARGTVTVESQLADRTTAAYHLAVGAATAYVAFGGRTQFAGKIIDTFSLDIGKYTGTLRVPWAVRGLAATARRLYVVVYQDGYPAILGYDIPGA